MKHALPIALVFAALAICPSLRADTFDDANRAYAGGRYSESSQRYQELLTKQGWSAPVLFNLANSRLHEGKLGEAVLNYERAQWLAPADPDITANLNLARKQAGLQAVPNIWMDGVADIFSPNAWAWTAWLSLAVLCVGVFGVKAWPTKRAWCAAVIALGFVSLGLAGVSIFATSKRAHRAVIMASETPALISPFAGAKAAFQLAAGEVIIVENSHGDFVLAKSPDGRSGWIDRAKIEGVVPFS